MSPSFHQESQMPISVTDDELAAIMDLATPIPLASRDDYLRSVAHRIEQHTGPVGIGTINAICRDVQREFFRPPDLTRGSDFSKYRR
jgi:hypothetical protein